MPPLKIRLALHRQYALQLFGSVIWSSLNRKLESLEISYNESLEISYNESTDEDIYFLDNKNFIQKKKRKDDHCYAAVNDINSSEDEFYNPKKRTKVTKLSKKK